MVFLRFAMFHSLFGIPWIFVCMLYVFFWVIHRCLNFICLPLMSHCACCHTCYTIQLMHYSHFKTHSLQHLKPILHNSFKNTNCKLLRTNAAIWFNKMRRIKQVNTQRTQISGRNSNGTKHSGGLPEDGREKRPKHVGVLYLQTRF